MHPYRHSVSRPVTQSYLPPRAPPSDPCRDFSGTERSMIPLMRQDGAWSPAIHNMETQPWSPLCTSPADPDIPLSFGFCSPASVPPALPSRAPGPQSFHAKFCGFHGMFPGATQPRHLLHAQARCPAGALATPHNVRLSSGFSYTTDFNSQQRRLFGKH